MADKIKNDLNSTFMTGTIVKDAELKHVGQSNFAILSFGFANDYAQKKGESWEQKVSFFDLRMYGKRAEAMSTYMKKGTRLSVQLKARQEVWDNKETGKKNSKVYFEVEQFAFAGGKSSGNKGSSEVSAPSADNAQPDIPTNGEGFPEDIPF